MHFDDVDAVQKVLPKRPSATSVSQVAVRRRDDPRVNGHWRGRPQRMYLFFL